MATTEKYCSHCDTTKPVAEFYVNQARSDGLSGRCCECQREAGNTSARSIRLEVLTLLGGKCAECDWDDPRALQIDHVNGGGVQERTTGGIRATSRAFLQRVLDNPGHYQLLCANHNWIKRIEQREHRNAESYVRTIPIERKATIGKGNGHGQKAALRRLTSDPEHQSKASRAYWASLTPEQLQARKEQIRKNATGRKLVTDPVTGKRHWQRPPIE